MTDLTRALVLFIITAAVTMALVGCSTAPAHEPYYDEEIEEAYTEECYCKGPPTTEVRYEDQR